VIVIDKRSTEPDYAFELWASCSACGWQNDGWVCAVSHLAAQTLDVDYAVARQRERVVEHHACSEQR
jgi:hypothetical protein